MIRILNKADCCGCNVCGDICTHNAISFKTDNEGFWYPEVDMQKCTDCHLCEKVCPMLHKAIENNSQPMIYGAYSKDEFIRLDSTSGGIFSELANVVYEDNGHVAGAIYNDNHTVSQVITPVRDDLPKLRSSKYVQSDAVGIYKQILLELKGGHHVLFCGTPCQVTALKNFVGEKYSSNLTTIDFICRGVNSPKVWLSYIEMLERQYKSKIVNIKAKDKKQGWHNFSLRVNFENGQEYCQDRYHDLFFIGFLQAGNFCRPSCYNCQFKGFPQAADITLADFWGIETLDPSMDQDKGTSLVVINTPKGAHLFEKIKPNIVYRQYSPLVLKNKAEANTSLIASVNNRNDFFDALDKMPFEELSRKFFTPKRPSGKVSTIRHYLRKLKWFYWVFERMNFSLSNFFFFIKYNYFNKHVRRVNGGFLLPLSDTVIQMESHAQLTIDGQLYIGNQQVKGAKQQTRILLEEGAHLSIKGVFTLGADSYIRVCNNGNLILHSSGVNEHTQLTIADVVEIGEDCVIGRDVVIRSYDGHTIISNDYRISKPIKVGNHVWIGQGATILKGVVVGDGAVIAANAVVTKDVPACCAVAGNPARVVKENVKWEK